MAKKEAQMKCENCESGFGYYRIKEKKWVCRACGFINEIKEEKDGRD